MEKRKDDLQRKLLAIAVKDEYTIDFDGLSSEYSEHEPEIQLVNNTSHF